jgi:NlpC/P60 family protein/SH3 domain-containing protein
MNLTVKKPSLAFLFLIALAASARASADDNTLVITLPPPSNPPPVSAPVAPPPDQQPPLTPGPEDTLDRPAPHANVVPPPHSVGVVGRLGVCVWPSAPIYRGQDGGGQLVGRVAPGTYLAIKSDYAGWYGVLMIDGSLGWIQKNEVRLLDYNVVRPPDSQGLGTEVLREAFRYLGVPYVWGGNGPSGLDCSGLVKNCFGHCGVSLPRRASEQARVGQPVPLSLAALRPGDRLYFAVGRPAIDHTAIYLGNGYFIHASMSRGRVGIDRLSKPLYGRHLVAARRSYG